MASKPKFKVGDPVWTKMKGYCAWPSRIADPSETNLNCPGRQKTPKTSQYLVYFFGSNDFAWMAEETIVPFSESKDQNKKKNKKATFKKGCLEIEEYIIENNLIEAPKDGAQDAAINDPSNDNAASPAELEDNNLNIDESCNAVDVVDDDVVAKLREKVAKKIEEKEARKSQLKEEKLSTKVSLKLKIINNHLDRFSKVSEVVAIAKSADQINTKNFNAAVQTFQGAILPKLGKCLGYFMKDNQKISTLSECRKCHDTLEDILRHIESAKYNAQVPNAVKVQLKKCSKSLKAQSNVMAFVNLEIRDKSNAMMERKQNDAES